MPCARNANENDPFDPTQWPIDDHEYRIYLDDHACRYVVLDQIDYDWFVQWRWTFKPSRGGRKFYAYRNLTLRSSGQRTNRSIFLHVAIMQRTGIAQPTPAHVVVDHRDGDSFNCRRTNLRWATLSMNRLNLNGKYGYDLIEDLQIVL